MFNLKFDFAKANNDTEFQYNLPLIYVIRYFFSGLILIYFMLPFGNDLLDLSHWEWNKLGEVNESGTN